MIKNLFCILTAFSFCCVFQCSVLSQQPKDPKSVDDKWIRVQSDDGEFSIEVPKEYNYFEDKNGFSVSNGLSDLPLMKMQMLNAVIEGSLISFERYEGRKDTLERLNELDKQHAQSVKKGEIKRDGVSIKEIIQKSSEFYSVRQYFHTANHIYLLTAASRLGETPEIIRFLDSLIIKKQTTDKSSEVVVLLSNLIQTQVILETNPTHSSKTPVATDTKNTKPKPLADGDKRLNIIYKSPPSYSAEARRTWTTGNIVLKITFSKNGFTPKIVIVKELPSGLLRQAVFCALRMKFLPEEKNHFPETVVKTVEYSFGIY